MGNGNLLPQLVDVLISGLSSGAVYAVMGTGLALIYGVCKLFNFAYGSFFVWGAYFAWIFFSRFPAISKYLVLALVVVIIYLMSRAIETTVIRSLRMKSDWDRTTMVVTLGLAILLDNLALAVFGPEGRPLPPLFTGSINLGKFVLNMHQVAMILLSLIIVTLLIAFLNKTRLGMAMRAVSQDTDGARIVGIKINEVVGQTFATSAVLAAIAGVLLSPLYFISPLGGWEVLVKAWVVTATGGMGSLKGALYAAFLLGTIEALVGWLWGLTWVMVCWFLVLLVVLIFRPQGLLGTWG